MIICRSAHDMTLGYNIIGHVFPLLYELIKIEHNVTCKRLYLLITTKKALSHIKCDKDPTFPDKIRIKATSF